MIDPVTKKECACPMNGKLCIDGVREDFPANSVGGKVQCRLWQHIRGKEPQSEKFVDHFDCAFAWIPVTTTETSQMAHQTAASVDKVRNEIHRVQRNIGNLGRALQGAAESIRQGIQTGTLQVLLPGQNHPDAGNGHDVRELKEKNGDR